MSEYLKMPIIEPGNGGGGIDVEIKPEAYNEMLKNMRNQIMHDRSTPEEFSAFLYMHDRSTPEEFSAFLYELPGESIGLARFMRELDKSTGWLSGDMLDTADDETKMKFRKKELMYILCTMDIDGASINIEDENSMQRILDLKKKFDFDKKVFVA